MKKQASWDRAYLLAQCKPFNYRIERDVLTDGTICYVAIDLDLRGCVGQGSTPDQAKENLFAARVDYIWSEMEYE